MTPHAILMFHNASMGLQDELPHVMQRVALIARLWGGYETHIAKRAGMSVSAFRLHEAMQWWLTADEAIDAHMADSVAVLPGYPTE
jgi:ATP-dependent protease ClpP protease subunit